MSLRSDHCGRLGADDAGRPVQLCGWVARRREHGEHLAFIDLRDHTGVVQCVVDGATDLRSEYVVRIVGTVRIRPAGTENRALATGEVEVGDCTVEILATSEPTPFPIDDRIDVDEVVRLRHRYVDLRRSRLQRNLRARAAMNSALRASMEDQGFVEIETPMLIASTPEGARDFVVPSRREPGAFYALPQSPQLFKQLCMVGGVDRYFQIARCLRDEDLRADRQYEFMQLDVEASFVTQDDVHEFIGVAVAAAVGAVRGEALAPIPHMTWADAMERFGSDKPDVRFGLELIEVTDVFEGTEFNAFRAECVKAICVPGGSDLGRARLDRLTEKAREWGAAGLAWLKVESGGLTSPIAKFLSSDEQRDLVSCTAAAAGDLLLLVADRRSVVRHVLGLLRLELGRMPVDQGDLSFLWITEFPLFEDVDASGRPVPAHHPFTMPHEADIDLLTGDGDLLSVRSQAYDLVCNGWELGSGSVRIHRADVQQQIFGLLGIGPDEATRRFGFLLDAFRYGAPPHAGFAIGLDRLAALLVGEENIREVIAFPKTQSGADPLTGAPTPIDPSHLRELGLGTGPSTTS